VFESRRDDGNWRARNDFRRSAVEGPAFAFALAVALAFAIAVALAFAVAVALAFAVAVALAFAVAVALAFAVAVALAFAFAVALAFLSVIPEGNPLFGALPLNHQRRAPGWPLTTK